MNKSLFGRTCLNPLHVTLAKFVHDEEKIMKTFKNITTYDDYANLEYTEREIDYESPIYLCTTVLELSMLHEPIK